MTIERVVRDINHVKEKKPDKEIKDTCKVKSLKEKTTETIKENNSTDNFMKFQWSWTL